MKKIILFSMALLAALTTTAAILQHRQQMFSEKLVRLHVVANSDAQADQALKLKVRDAVLTVTQAVEDKTQLADALPQIQEAAQACLRSNGSGDQVTVTLQKEHFPTRVYDNFSLPAGVYTALRVNIGEAKGQNWWCVAFPSICLRATADDLEQAALTGGFNEDEIALITEDGSEYVLKFKALELLDTLKQVLF